MEIILHCNECMRNREHEVKNETLSCIVCGHTFDPKEIKKSKPPKEMKDNPFIPWWNRIWGESDDG